MRTIHKFPISFKGMFSIDLPVQAKFLKAAMQIDGPMMWFEVDTEFEMVKRTFRIFGTGHPMNPQFEHEHLDTFFDGPFVWHLYRLIDMGAPKEIDQ